MVCLRIVSVGVYVLATIDVAIPVNKVVQYYSNVGSISRFTGAGSSSADQTGVFSSVVHNMVLIPTGPNVCHRGYV